MARRRLLNSLTDSLGEANVLPILNVMFLLIPALLLAMEIASVAAIDVSPPRLCDCGSDPAEPQEPALDLHVMIRADGHHIRVQGQDTGPIVASVGGHDFAELELRAQAYKHKHPHEVTVTVSAEPGTSFGVLIETLDALRGSDCQLKRVLPGEPIPEECCSRLR